MYSWFPISVVILKPNDDQIILENIISLTWDHQWFQIFLFPS